MRYPMPKDLTQRWLLRVDKRDDGCWNWAGATWPSGYGRFMLPLDQGGYRIGAHVWGYRRFVGDYPDDLELDHLCRNRRCVNPEHLEPVTHQENVIRGISGQVNADRQRAVTHCPRGHEYTESNTYYRQDRTRGRNCRACGVIVTAKRKAAARAAKKETSP